MNSKNIQITFLFLLVTVFSFAQQRYVTRDGRISFFSEAPLENIEAHNRQVTSLLDIEKNEVVASMFIKDFEFRKSLMQEHFNENYLESDKFPKATFQGVLKGQQPIDVTKNGTYQVEADGKLTVHGVTKAVKIAGTLEVKDNTVIVKGKFKIAIRDYNIDVPSIVVKNIAEIVEVTVDLKYSAQKI